MNKKQLIFAWGMGILIFISIVLIPQINWKRPTSEQDKINIQQTITKRNRLYFIYLPSIILIIGSLLIYALRDKKK